MKITIALVLVLAAVGCSSGSSNSLSDSLDAPALDRSSLAWTEPGATPDPDRAPEPPEEQQDSALADDAGADGGRDAGRDAGDAASDGQAGDADAEFDIEDGGFFPGDADLPAV